MKKRNHHTDTQPPRIAEKLLLWFLRDDLAEEVLGDLGEKFFQTCEKQSLKKARHNYWYQVMHYARPFAIKSFRSKRINTSMVRHNFAISFRQLLKSKVYSFINIGGLALGMAVAMLIGLWVNDELSYNKYHDNHDHIVQLLRHEPSATSTTMTTGMGTLIAEKFPDHFERVVMVRGRVEERTLAFNNLKFTQSGYFIQEEGPGLLGLKMKYGSHSGLADINSIILSASVANKLFGDIDPINKVIRMNAEWDLKVTGVYEDLPGNSEFNDASYFSTLDRYLKDRAGLNVWSNYNMYVFGQLNPQSNIDEVSELIEAAFMERLAGQNDGNTAFFLNPMSEWHLNSEFENGQRVTSKAQLFVWFYTVIGAFVLILACINFMNLSTARSEKRAQEVGIRKTLGSTRSELVAQFYMESLLYSLLAFALSLVLLSATLPWFNNASGKSMIQPWLDADFWMLSIGFMLVTAFLAGSYPAAYLSSFQPVKALKGTFSTGKRASLPRKVLVVFQFTISIALIIGTITVNNQIRFAKNRPVGYSPEGMIGLRPASPDFNKKLPVIKEQLKNTGVVASVGAANYAVSTTRGWSGGFEWAGMENTQNISFNTISISHDYGKTVGLEFVSGRDFSRDFATDKQAILINRSAMETMGLDNPVGQKLTRVSDWKDPEHYIIIGVVEDMIKGSPFESTSQSIMFLEQREMRWLYIRVNPAVSLSSAIPVIEAQFNQVYPAAPFDFQFTDAEYASKFEAEERIANLAGFFSLLAVIISCLGLFGLASYVAEQRTKEIGIRKVLGASISQLWHLLSRDFAMLTLIACLIAIPLAYSVMSGWLADYEDVRTPIYWWVFAYAGGGALVLTLVTVSFQAIRASITNPVNALRSE
ncbi:MAG: FtsX-like permease family protein [Roseivirga sp.]|nr:FtsX-like permease family protein [Roseivirga sp.]